MSVLDSTVVFKSYCVLAAECSSDVIICLDSSLTADGAPFIVGQLISGTTSRDQCGNIFYNYYLHYASADLADPATPLVTSQIASVTAKNCLTDYIDWKINQNVILSNRLLWTNSEYVDVADTTDETVVGLYSMPAGLMSAKDALKLMYYYHMISTGGPPADLTRRLYFGSTMVLEETYADGDGVDYYESIDFWIANLNNPAIQEVQYRFFGYMYDALGISGTLLNTMTEDTSVPLDIRLTMQWSVADPALIVRLGYSNIELLKAPV